MEPDGEKLKSLQRGATKGTAAATCGSVVDLKAVKVSPKESTPLVDACSQYSNYAQL
jgi:hypothetical protein